jgi:hypothetical protein
MKISLAQGATQIWDQLIAAARREGKAVVMLLRARPAVSPAMPTSAAHQRTSIAYRNSSYSVFNVDAGSVGWHYETRRKQDEGRQSIC